MAPLESQIFCEITARLYTQWHEWSIHRGLLDNGTGGGGRVPPSSLFFGGGGGGGFLPAAAAALGPGFAAEGGGGGVGVGLFVRPPKPTLPANPPTRSEMAYFWFIELAF